MGAAERLPVPVGGGDVVEAGKRPEAVAGVVVDRRVVTERAVGLVGIVEEVRGERINSTVGGVIRSTPAEASLSIPVHLTPPAPLRLHSTRPPVG